MKKLLLIIAVLFFKSTFSQKGNGHSIMSLTNPKALVWGATAFQDSLWAFDTTGWVKTIGVQPVTTGSVITGITGMAFDPTTYKTYAIVKIAPSRYLAEISLPSGSCTVLGDLGDKFASITFDKYGQLYGATGNGATTSQTFFKINKANATNTVVFAMGNGADGEIVCYNRFDDNIYHWSGNGTVVFEKWLLASTTYTPTNITISSAPGETFGSVYLNPTQFLTANISSEMMHFSTTGNIGSNLLSPVAPDDLRGLLMPPAFAINTSTVCQKVGTVTIDATCLQEFDSVYYNWGDGVINQISAVNAVTNTSSHTYTATGNFTISVSLYNGAVPKSVILTQTISVLNTPTVTLTGNTNLCPSATLILTGSSGGTSQWYKGGVLIPGATSNTIAVSSPGVYNMIKTNLNTCGDSAAIGKVVVVAPAPTITVNSGTICAGSSFTIVPSGASTYTLQGGLSVVSPTTASTYTVNGTSAAGCLSANTATSSVSVNALPTISAVSNSSLICTGQSATLTASGANTYTWSTSATTSVIVVNPTVTTTYTLNGTNAAGCSNLTTLTQSVSTCIGLQNLANAQSSLIVYPNPSKGIFNISATQDLNIEVTDVLGKIILSKKINADNYKLDLGDNSNGLYFLKATLNGQIQIIKLIKE